MRNSNRKGVFCVKIKRALLAVLAAAGVMAAAVPVIQAAPAADKVIAHFNYSEKPAWYDDGFASSMTLDGGVKQGDSGSSLKITVPDANGYPVYGFNGGSEWAYDGWENYNAVRFWVRAEQKTSQMTYLRMGFRIQDHTDYADCWLKNGGAYDMEGYGLQTAAPEGSGGGIVLYPGYEGMVTIPFSSLAFAPEKGSNRIILSTDKAFAGWELYIDDVTLTTVSEAVTLENFDGYEAGDSVPTSYLSAGTAVSFVTSPAAAGTAVKGVLAAGVYNQICFSRDSLGSAFFADWKSAGNALRFWVSGSQGSGPEPGYKLELYVQDADENRVTLKPAANVYFGEEKKAALADKGIYIPTDYTGYITVPFSSFAEGMDFARAYQILFSYGDYFAGTVVYLDDIGVASVTEDGSDDEEDRVITDSGKPAILPENAKVIQNFDSLTGETAAEVLHVYEESAAAELCDTIFDGVSGKSWKVTTKDDAYGTLQIYNTAGDLSGTNALRFYVRYEQINKYQYNYFKLENIRVDTNDSTTTWRMDRGAAYYLVDMEGNRTAKMENGDGTYAVVLDSGFEGYVEIPFTSLVNTGTELLYSETGNPIDLANVNQIVFCVSGSWFKNNTTVYIDSIAMVTGDYPAPVGTVTVMDNADSGFVLDAQAGVFPYDTLVTVDRIEAGSRLETNLLELLMDEYGCEKANLYAVKSVRAEAANIESMNKNGTSLRIAFQLPAGYRNSQIIAFMDGTPVALDSETADGKIYADIIRFGSFSFAVAEMPEKSDEPGVDPEPPVNTGVPMSAAPAVGILALAVLAAAWRMEKYTIRGRRNS